ncbi:tRNA (cytidine(34)-2'-O)-methyltransferase [Alicyclobacillaceae bacterium I2511]|nr:tRNA (cytidine(34)-2'-O)-methyltransferase [Alicyclobacillaceae bacterium I2511]
MHLVLVEPEIPANTGNVARTCAVTGCALHLVHPLGFSVDDKHLKRAGLDYWHMLQVYHHNSIESLWEDNPLARFWYVETSGQRYYANVDYQDGDFLVFGKETTGLRPEILTRCVESVIRIPILPQARSLNLSNAVALVTFEALRQLNFPGMA